MEHEIRRKTITVSLDSLVQSARRHAVKFGQVKVENDLFVAQKVDERSNFFRDEQTAGDGGAEFGGDFLFCGHGSGVGGLLGGGVENGIVHFCDDLSDAEAEKISKDHSARVSLPLKYATIDLWNR